LKNDSNQNTENDHCGNREIEPEIFFLNSDIARQVSYPVQLIMEKINDYACEENYSSGEHNIFSRLRTHVGSGKI